MEESGIMNYLRTDKELAEMRKKWKEHGIEKVFPPFNYDEYNGTDGYKKTIKKLLSDYEKKKM